MEIADLDTMTLVSLLTDLQMTYDTSIIAKKYGVSIPHWLTIKYRCVDCFKETRSRIQTMSIKQANKQLTCPFCRKISKMYTIHVEKEMNGLTAKDFITN